MIQTRTDRATSRKSFEAGRGSPSGGSWSFPTAGQADHGASLAAQKATLAAEAGRRGWDFEVVADEGLSAKNLNRAGLQSALERLDRGQADFLLAIRLDRISRSVADFAGLLDRGTKRRWGLVLLSPNIDTSDPAERFTSNVLASAAQYERELIGARTREGMAQRKAEGQKMGRPRTMDSTVVARIVGEKKSGRSLLAIADALTAEGVPTARGGRRWYASTVKAVLQGGG
ncbi:recombinase family protein [Arthrobacter sp. FW305-BF8]|uniref:recombinase family protein n=1 Tax=Arthrobacter sp. FW305-BF8 TaxID=2879617 RepID=UPI001F46D6A1|nr:recombinase family protein [Arthrobacter sp. FW305-BF8]UKA55160.1 recombinase family protein [Arthrobacter sp. FW305-BF8]